MQNCFDDKKVRCKVRLFYFTHVFITVHITIHNFYYLLSLHKAQVKTKTYCLTNNVKVEKIMTIKCFDNIIMLRFGKTEEFYGAKKSNNNLGCEC